MKTKQSPKLLENYSREDLGLYMLLAAFTNGHKISSSSLSKKDIDELNEKAKKYFSEKKYQESFELFKSICIHDNLDQRGWKGMGMCCQLVGKFKEAISFYECASRIDSTDPVPLYGICNCYLGLKQYLEAIETAKVVIELCKKSPKFEHARLGEGVEYLIESIDVVRKTIPFTVLRYPKKLEQPKIHLKNPLTIEEFWNEEKREGLKEYESFKKSIDTQKTSFYPIRKINSKKIEELYSLGHMYYERGNFREAMKVFVIMSRYSHLDQRSWMSLAATLEQAGIYEKAISAYHAIAHLDPKDPQPYFYISFCYQLLSNKTEAEKFAEKAFQRMNTGIKV